jgi:serine/threonine protein kinase
MRLAGWIAIMKHPRQDPMLDIRSALESGLAGLYEIERELGRGGMTRVFLAHDRKHDRRVGSRS